MAKDTVGYRLKKGSAATAGPISFAGIPGIYSEDEAVAVFDLGLSESEMDDLIAEAGLADQLEKVKNAKPTRVEGQMVSGADVPPKSPEQQAEEEAALAEPADADAASSSKSAGGEK